MIQSPTRRLVTESSLEKALHEYRLETFGAAGDGVTDDIVAINTALAAMSPGDRLVVTPGKVFAHTGVINLTTPGIQVVGGEFKGLDSAHCAMYLTGAGVVVSNVKKTVAWTTRTNTQDSHSFVVKGSNQVLDHCTADGAGGVGIFVFGASDFLIDAPLVMNTGADGIHVTYGATRGELRSPRIYTAADDHLAFVSYSGDPTPVKDVWATDVLVDCTLQTHGRGIAVVGGEDIVVDGYKVIKSWGAAIYINIEIAYPSKDIKRIRFLRGEITQPNRGWGDPVTPVNHGGILISNQQTNTLDDVEIRDCVMRDAGISMPAVGRMIAFQNQSTGAFTNVRIEDFKARGTLPATFYSDPNTVTSTSTFRGINFGVLPTASLPVPSTFKVPAGATVFDSTINASAYCTGTTWANYGVVTDPGFVKLAANQSVTNSTAQTPLTGLGISVAANATYVIRAMVTYDGSASGGTGGDIAVSWTIPGSATMDWGGSGLASSVTANTGSLNGVKQQGGGNTLAFGANGVGTKLFVVLHGVLSTVGAAGTLQLNFSQFTLDATNPTTVYAAGTWVRAERVA